MEVLLLDNEGLMHTTLEFKLQKAGMVPVYINQADEVTDVIKGRDIAIAILDLDIEKSDVEMMLTVCESGADNAIPVLGITSLEDEEQILYWLHKGIHDFIAKPYKTSEIIIRIKKALSAIEVKS